jgi:hypothetical protein
MRMWMCVALVYIAKIGMLMFDTIDVLASSCVYMSHAAIVRAYDATFGFV